MLLNHNEGEGLKASGIIDSWEPKLEAVWQEILAAAASKKDEDRNTRLARIIEYNRFKDMLEAIKWLYNDKEAVTRYTKKIASITSELDHENVGDDISKLVEKVEMLLLKDRRSITEINANIDRCIALIKRGEEVIPVGRKNELIHWLNECIIARNRGS